MAKCTVEAMIKKVSLGKGGVDIHLRAMTTSVKPATLATLARAAGNLKEGFKVDLESLQGDFGFASEE